MDSPERLSVSQNDEAISDTLRYSVESYAYTYQNNANTQLAELVKDMIRYGDAAGRFAN